MTKIPFAVPLWCPRDTRMSHKYWGLYYFWVKVYGWESLWLWIIDATSGIKDYYVLGIMEMKDRV